MMPLHRLRPKPLQGARDPKALTTIVLNGVGVTAASKMAEGVLHIGVLMVLARLLTPADFGVLTATLIVLGLATMSYQLGVGPALIQRQTITPEHISTGFWFTQGLALALSALVLLSADAFQAVMRVDGLSACLRLASLLFIVEGAGAVSTALLLRDMNFRYLAMIKVVSYASGYGIIGISLAIIGAGVWSLITAHLAQGMLHTFLAIRGRPLQLRAAFSFTAWKQLAFFGAGLTLGKVANYSATQGDNIITGRYLGTEALGLYGRAYQTLMLPATIFGRAIDKVMFPVLSSIQTDNRRILSAFNRAVTSIGIVVMPLSVLCALAAPELIAVLFGPGWTAAAEPFQILALAMFCRTAYKVADATARALGLVYRRAWRQMIYGATVIVGSYLGSRFGTVGVATAVLLAITINYVVMCDLCYARLRGARMSLVAAHIPGLGLAIASAAVTWPIVLLGRHLAAPPLVILITALPCVVAVVALILIITEPAAAHRAEWKASQGVVHEVRRLARRLVAGPTNA